MSELADRIRARDGESTTDGWFRREEAADAAADDGTGGSETRGEVDGGERPEARVFVVSSNTHPEVPGEGESWGPTPAPSRRHALARKPPFWLTRPCPPWCHSDHTDRDRPADRRHVSPPEGSVVLTEAEAVQASDGSWQAQDIHVSLTQHVREIEPLIACGGLGPAGAWHLTVAEAKELAAALARAVAAAERT
jgi:hypothetical protein